jgi:hypothetical protein
MKISLMVTSIDIPFRYEIVPTCVESVENSTTTRIGRSSRPTRNPALRHSSAGVRALNLSVDITHGPDGGAFVPARNAQQTILPVEGGATHAQRKRAPGALRSRDKSLIHCGHV